MPCIGLKISIFIFILSILYFMTKARFAFSLLVFILGYLMISSLGIAQERQKLFDSEEPLSLRMAVSIKALKAESNDSTYVDGEIQLETTPGNWEAFPFDMRTRGNFRLNECFYPPMRIRLKKKEAEGSVFQGNRNLKLVLPCSKTKNADSFIGKEYLAYKFYEQVTEYHFRTRLVRVKFTNLDDRKAEEVELLGFVIEDNDEVAERFDGKILKDKKIAPILMDDLPTLRHDFFQMMIGNTDWSTLFQHNQEVMLIGEKTVIPMAYDFDMTGLVNPPYAQVSTLVELESVKDRLYRGFCRNEPMMQAVRKEFLEKEEQFYTEIDNQKLYYSEAEAKAIRSYLKEFFDMLRSDRMFTEKILKSCRTVDGSVMK